MKSQNYTKEGIRRISFNPGQAISSALGEALSASYNSCRAGTPGVLDSNPGKVPLPEKKQSHSFLLKNAGQ